MQFKFKPKFIQRITATLTALSITLTSLSATSFAMSGDGGGGTSTAALGKYTYDYDTNANLSWKIDMYVSANPNGKIDVANDKIDTDKLPWVGSVMYDNFFKGSEVNKNQVWLSTEYTNNCRDTFSRGFIGSQWTLPHATRVTEDKKAYLLSNTMTVAHYTGNQLGLPTDVDSIKDIATYKAIVQNKIEDNNNLEWILKNINASLTDKDGNPGTNDNLKPLYEKILPLLGSTPKAKLVASKEATGKTDYDLLLPTSENCVVEWALVATPVVGWRARLSNAAFWEVYDESNNFTILGNGIPKVTLGMDAYTTAVYNETSKALYKNLDYVKSLVDMGLDPLRENWRVYKNWSGTNFYYEKGGKILNEYDKVSYNVAKAAFDMHDVAEYCGIPSLGSSASPTNFNCLSTNPAKFAQYGGITVYKNTIPDPGIPVFYYEYDPNTNQPTGNVFTETFQPNGDTTAKFQPSEAHGIPIAAESHKNGHSCVSTR